MVTSDKFEIFISPAGFIEQKFTGMQTAQSITDGVKELVKCGRKLFAQKKPVLILIDITEVPKVNMSEQMHQLPKDIVRAMKEEKYDRIAVYGDLAVQVLINTLVLIAGKRRKIRVFPERIDALAWLKAKG
jgi:uncharacterized protein YeeX (DUF496 family)